MAKFVRLLLVGTSGTAYVYHYVLYGSNDGSTWENIKSGSTSSITQVQVNNQIVTGDMTYRYFRLGTARNGNVQASASVRSVDIYGLDYSEREFAEGSTMKYIYDHGVELEELTADGFQYSTYTMRPAEYSPNSFSMELGNNYFACSATANKIDLTDYQRIRCKITEGYSGKGGYLNKFVWDAKTNMNNVAYSDTQQSTLLNPYLDIDSISGTYYVAVGGGWVGTPVGKSTVTEWWLE